MPCEYFLLIRRQQRPCLLAIDDGLSLAGQHAGCVWHCCSGIRKSIWSVTTEWRGGGMVTCWERDANDDMHIVQLMPLPPYHLLLYWNPEWFTFPVQAYPGCLKERPFSWCLLSHLKHVSILSRNRFIWLVQWFIYKNIYKTQPNSLITLTFPSYHEMSPKRQGNEIIWLCFMNSCT